MKRDADWFEDRELDLIYIAKKLRDATALEGHLTEAGFDYAVEPDEYQGGVIFRRTRIGAFFYVLPETREAALAVLRQKGFRLAVPELRG
jgi:voltage-gated potassium channel Kch